MARRKTGRTVEGWLVLDKPAGLGSTEAVTRARRALNARKAGHAGTLDPDATGVLAIAFGEATKTVPHVQDGAKTYRFAVRFGAETTTDDAAGTPTRTSGLRPDAEAIRAALPAFRGDILQVPPAVSAVRVGGKRAYDLAREGAAPALAARPLHVAALDLDALDGDTGHFTMTCGKGGYVRAIARDLGRALGGAAHCLWLRREASGPFRAEGALPADALDDMTAEEIEGRLLPLQAALVDLPELRATEAGALRLANGNPGEAVPAGPAPDWGAPAWASRGGVALALGRWRGGLLHPDRVFVRG